MIREGEADENMVFKLAAFAADITSLKGQSQRATKHQDETNQLVTFFNFHLGRSMEADFWDKLESTMMFLSILGVRWLEMNGHKELAYELREDNLPHPLPYLYECTRESDNHDLLLVDREPDRTVDTSTRKIYCFLVKTYKQNSSFKNV
jgi:hypothetical protein